MKKLILFLSMFIFVLHGQKDVFAAIKPLRATIALYSYDRFAGNGCIDCADPILLGTAVCIAQSASPLIVSKGLFNKIVKVHAYIQAHPLSDGDVNQILVKAKEIAGFIEFVKERYSSVAAVAGLFGDGSSAVASLSHAAEHLMNMIIYLLTQDLADQSRSLWSIFFDENSQCYLLIPTWYSGSVSVCGFNLSSDHSIAFGDVLAHVSSSPCYAVEDLLPGDSPRFKELEKLFVHKSGPWNIFLIGHGMYTTTEPDSCVLAKNFDLSQTAQNGVIADMPVREFQRFLQFLNTDIKTATLTYKTCFGGGYHLYAPYFTRGLAEQLIPLDLNYTVVCGCFSNYPVLLPVSDLVFHENCSFEVSPWFYLLRKLEQAQDKLKAFFGRGLITVQTVRAILFEKIQDSFLNFAHMFNHLAHYAEKGEIDDLNRALDVSISPLSSSQLYKKMTMLAQVRLPHAVEFKPHISSSNLANTCMISDEYIQTLRGDRREITLVDHLALFVNSRRVFVPVQIKGSCPAFISLAPIDGYHIFDKISVDTTLNCFIKNSFCYHPIIADNKVYDEIPYARFFLIKELSTSCVNKLISWIPFRRPELSVPAELHNVCIIMQPGVSDTVRSSVRVIFQSDVMQNGSLKPALIVGSFCVGAKDLSWQCYFQQDAEAFDLIFGDLNSVADSAIESVDSSQCFLIQALRLGLDMSGLIKSNLLEEKNNLELYIASIDAFFSAHTRDIEMGEDESVTDSSTKKKKTSYPLRKKARVSKKPKIKK